MRFLPPTCLALALLLASPAAQETPLAQGVRGTIQAPDGQPAVGARVYVFDTSIHSLFGQLQAKSRGEPVAPIATGTTGERGEFKLAISGKRPDACEIHVVHDGSPTLAVPQAFRVGRWADIGTRRLERGHTVIGKITAVKGGTPVAGATVRIERVREEPLKVRTPGREHGIVVTTDGSGWFRCDAVAAGEVTFAACADGFAWKKVGAVVRPVEENRVAIALPPGAEIGGAVVDPDGHGIAEVRVVVTAFSDPAFVEEVRTDGEGRFIAIGLPPGAYSLQCTTPGYVNSVLRPIRAGDRSVSVVMEPHGSVRVIAAGAAGQPLRNFSVTVRKHTEGQKLPSRPITQREVQANENGAATVHGIPPGRYVVDVVAEGHCKTFSEAFEVQHGAKPPRVLVRLTEGGAIEGTVTDADGKPLAGATVLTLPNHLDDNPFTAMFSSLIAFRITQTNATTDAKGKYRLALLTPGTYQLQVAAEGYGELRRKGHEVTDGETTSAPPLVLARGSAVRGLVRVDGKPAAGVRVTLWQTPAQNARSPMSATSAVTGPDGRFEFDKWFVPGNYTISAMRTHLVPELQRDDITATREVIAVRAGRDVVHDIAIK